MEQHKEFPSFWSAVLILALLVGLQIFMGLLAYGLGIRFESGDPEVAAVLIVLSNGVLISVLMSYKSLNYKSIFHFSRNSVKSTVIALGLPIVLTTGGAVFWISDITDLIVAFFPMSDAEYQMFNRFFNGGIISITTACLVAPTVEEILFRGIFLRSFLANYSARNAIILSSMLFALYHLNIYQFPVAFLFGCFSAWLYVNTRSLWPSIMAHITYNSLTTFFSYAQEIPEDLPKHAATGAIPVWVVILSVAVTAWGIIILARIFYPDKQGIT
jgi:membrane protease YdiL (CAAX protease family)